MESDRIFFRGLITAAFLGHDMQELRAFQVTHVLQCADKPHDIVTIDGPM